MISDTNSLEGSKQYRDRMQSPSMKKTIEAEKRDKELFTKVRKMKDLEVQAEQFGRLADYKDSRAVKISNFATTTKAAHNTIIDFDEQYFADMKRKNSRSFMQADTKDRAESVYHSMVDTN